MSQTRSIYRQLLKEVHWQYTKTANTDLYVNELRSVYQQNKTISDPKEIAAMNQSAADVLSFLKGSRQHRELRARYAGIVMQQKEKIEKSANLVGLQLPEQYDPASPKPLGGQEKEIADRVNKAFTKQ